MSFEGLRKGSIAASSRAVLFSVMCLLMARVPHTHFRAGLAIVVAVDTYIRMQQLLELSR